MKKKLKTVIVILVIFILCFLYAHIAKTHIIYDKYVDNSEYVSTGIIEDDIEQTFICQEDTLDGISAKCTVLGDVSDNYVKVTLIDCETDGVIGQSEMKGKDLTNSKFNVFEFDTISQCKGKTYKVVFETIGSSVSSGNGVAFSIQPGIEKNTSLSIDNKKTEGTLIVKTVTDRFDLETIIILLLFVGYIVIFMKVLYKLFK